MQYLYVGKDQLTTLGGNPDGRNDNCVVHTGCGDAWLSCFVVLRYTPVVSLLCYALVVADKAVLLFCYMWSLLPSRVHVHVMGPP